MNRYEFSDHLAAKLKRMKAEYDWLLFLWTRTPLGIDPMTQADVDRIKADYTNKKGETKQ